MELQLLPHLQTAMAVPNSTRRMDAIFATLVLLNTLERDTWRLTYWTTHVEEVRRPSCCTKGSGLAHLTPGGLRITSSRAAGNPGREEHLRGLSSSL